MRKIPIIVLCVLVLACLSLESGVSAADSFAYRLAYISDDDGEIWTINPDGTDAHEITHDGAHKTDLVASPDGKYLAYNDQKYVIGEENQNPAVIVLNIAASEQHTITGHEVITDLLWSPDSQKLLLGILTREGDFANHFETHSINRDGSQRTQLGEASNSYMGLGWSPDGKYILRTYPWTDTGLHIDVMDSDGSHEHEIIHFDQCFICAPPEWTPDNKFIVFYKHPDLYIMDADGQHLRQLTDFTKVYNVIDVAYARYGAPSFSLSADSKTLYYTMGYPIQIVKLALTADGWAQRTVLYDNQTHIIGGNLLSPDGKLIFFSADGPQGNLLSSLDVDSHEVRVLATNVSEPVIVSA